MRDRCDKSRAHSPVGRERPPLPHSARMPRSGHSLRLDRKCDSSRIAHPRDYILVVSRGVTVRPHSPLSAGPYMQNLRPPHSHRPTAAATHDQPVGHGREWKEGSKRKRAERSSRYEAIVVHWRQKSLSHSRELAVRCW